ncbi:hypothetical protein J3R30DRAFT_3653485 [Lentinula aciculospora]|uniref:RRM domain-containing protein n=1 Tax=Lentinula aciculospora TaxID=153920 RepID=A0A9W9ATK6_9AGAR|nr:hypothetical protein J3R30DRAFT_3653485 [Lentinula aciculospora]
MSKVVFVGNVPYNMGEEQLIDVFRSVGQVVGFRLVFDRDTGKPKGYGFCEFSDHETASSAVRNLNNYEVGGRPLRIDLADSDPFLEGKTTVRGELMDGAGPSDRWRSDKAQDFLMSVPPGIPVPVGSTVLDTISQTLATINPSQLMDVLAHMKAFVITHPEQARTLLVSHPQFAYALFQALLLNKIVDQSILQRMLAATVGNTAPPTPTPVNAPPQQFYPSSGNYTASAHMPPFPPNMAAPMFAPPASSMPPPNYFRPTPPPVSHQPAPMQANMYQHAPPPAQALLRQVVSMSDEQVNALPETERTAIMQLVCPFLCLH